MAGNYGHDVFRHLTSANLAVASAGGAAASTAVFTDQTYAVRLATTGIVTSTSGIRYSIGNAPVADSTSALLPVGWVEFVKCTPGQKISAIGNDPTVPAPLTIVQLTD